MNRPTGVTVLAVLNFIGAGLEIICALLMFVGGAFLGTFLSQMAANSGRAAGAGIGAAIGIAFGIVFIVMAAISAIVGFGLWNLKEWGRIVEIVIGSLGALIQAIGLLGSLSHFRMGAILWNLTWLAFDAWIIFYLVQPHVKAAFAQRPSMQAAAGD
jgi:hypothetical protein